MKNILHYILIAAIIFLIGVIIYQHNIIKDNQSIEIEEQKNHNDTLNFVKKEKDIQYEFQKIDDEIQKCMKKENYTTMGMSHCVLISEPEYDKIIKKSMSGLKKIVVPETYNLILESQKKWEAYRDAQKKVIYKTIWNLQGTMHINISDGEAVYITEQRAKDLADILNMMKNGNYIH